MSGSFFKIVILSIGIGIALIATYLTVSSTRFKQAPLIVAVIDTGVESDFLNKNRGVFFKNQAEMPSNQIDDDGNGYVDDVMGWNFFDQNGDIQDESGHGTQVIQEVIRSAQSTQFTQGEQLRQTQQFTAMDRTSNQFQILPIKMTKHGVGVRPADLTRAIKYAIRFNARVINLSAGLLEGSEELQAAVQEAFSKDILIIVAAGRGIPNPFQPIPVSTLFPQSYPETIVVGAASPDGLPELSENFGPRIDFVVARNKDSKFYGSSGAVATVSGLVVQYLLSHSISSRDFTPEQMRSLLRSAARPPDDFKPKINTDQWPEYLSRFGHGVLDGEAFLKEE